MTAYTIPSLHALAHGAQTHLQLPLLQVSYTACCVNEPASSDSASTALPTPRWGTTATVGRGEHARVSVIPPVHYSLKAARQAGASLLLQEHFPDIYAGFLQARVVSNCSASVTEVLRDVVLQLVCAYCCCCCLLLLPTAAIGVRSSKNKACLQYQLHFSYNHVVRLSIMRSMM
jgi:hypothetical protein